MRARRWQRPVAIAVAVPVAFLLLTTVAWAIDASTGGTTVRRNVAVAGRDVGGLSQDDLLPVLRELDDEVGATKVSLIAGSKTLESTGAELGLRLDAEATAAAALAVGRDHALLTRPFRWIGSFFGRDDAPLRLDVDAAQTTATVRRLEREVRTDPTEPTLAYREPDLVLVPGRDGEGLDASEVAAALAEVTEVDGGPIVLEVDTSPIPPRFADQATELLEQANEATSGEIVVEIDGNRRTIPGATLRPHLRSAVIDDKLLFDLDPAGTADLLRETFADLAVEPGSGSLSISDGRVVVRPGTAGKVCCTPDSITALAQALRTGAVAELEMAAASSTKDAAYYEQLGVKELVAEFTTSHACCAPRVENIHRIADLLRGAIIAPGETFSVNGFVGPRTRAKGFVAAPVINGDGNFDEDVGGGISQFVTTLFNAAFFAGLDIPEYMAHGLYISRYPYGREATISHPSPDLKIRNSTPYGVMIWPTYTDTEIRIALYSTRYVVGEQTGQFEERYDVACTQVVTTRTRTWLNTGETKTDRFYAIYASGEGVQCDGSTRPKPGETTTTTSSTVPGAPGATTTAPPGATTTTTASSTTTTTTPPGSSTTTSTAPTTTASTAGGG